MYERGTIDSVAKKTSRTRAFGTFLCAITSRDERVPGNTNRLLRKQLSGFFFSRLLVCTSVNDGRRYVSVCQKKKTRPRPTKIYLAESPSGRFVP